MITRESPFDRRRPASLAAVLFAMLAMLPGPAAAGDGNAGSPPLSQGSSRHGPLGSFDENVLSADPVWLALLAYRPDPLRAAPPGRGWRSEADRPDFFLSPRGAKDPAAELLADVDAMFGVADTGGDPDRSARCRFPARFTWLKEKLGIDDGAGLLAQCPALAAWHEGVAADRVSIAFASAYLESPSSTFGHTFLRFERRGVPTLWTATSNYEADSGRDTGAVAFVAKGLFGGFPGIADQRPFYRRLKVYGDVEGRDIWDYPLRLDARRIDLLLFSLWEVKDGVFDYFFLGENCSYRTLALLAVVAPEARLLDGFPLEVVPIDTIRVLRDRGLAGEPVYWPSAVRTLSRHARTLTAEEQRTVVAIAHGLRPPEVLAPRSREDRARLLRAAAEYSSILIHRGELDFETRDRVTQDLVRARLATDLPLPPDPAPRPPSPDHGHGGRMVSLGWVNRHGGDGVELALAGFRHERVDRLAGYERGAQILVLGGRALVTSGGGVRLESADLLRVESTSPSDRFFRQPAWTLHLGASRKHVDRGRPLLGTLSYARGGAFDVGVGVLALTVGASLDSAPSLRGGMAMELTGAATLTRQGPWLSWETFVEHGRYAFGDHSHRLDYGLRVGVPLTRNQGIVLEFQRGGADVQENVVRAELRLFF